MNKYLHRLNGLIYDAIQLVDINGANPEQAVTLFQAKLNEWGKPYYPIHWTWGNARQGRVVILDFSHQTCTLYEGEWLVRDNLGHINPVHQEDFERNYVLIEEEKIEISESDMWDFIKI